MLSPRMYSKLDQVKEVGGANQYGKYNDFDLVCKVLQMFKLDAYTSELRVCDDTGEIYFTQIYNLKFRSLREGAYVRIRSANLENHH